MVYTRYYARDRLFCILGSAQNRFSNFKLQTQCPVVHRTLMFQSFYCLFNARYDSFKTSGTYPYW